MVVYETHPGMSFSRYGITFSDEDKEEINSILSRLKDIFNAKSAKFVDPKLTIGMRTDYKIEIEDADCISNTIMREVNKICERLSNVFEAESVGFLTDEIYENRFRYVIKIYDGYNNGYIL